MAPTGDEETVIVGHASENPKDLDAQDVALQAAAEPVREMRAPSWWTPERLEEAIRQLPAAELYPDLTNRAVTILAGWYKRFPVKVWSRFVKIADSGTGRTQQIPKVLKEFNESAPVLSRLMSWVSDSYATDKKPLDIIDLCSGFGFLSMFASELLPSDAVECIYLVDRSWPNRGVSQAGPNSDHISSDHIYEHGSWRIPLLTLKSDMCKGADIRGLARHVVSEERPAILCGIHLCGTLSLRACQLFNDSLSSGCGVIGMILAPCCLPRPQHRKRRFLYDVGGHRFSATELFARHVGKIKDGQCIKSEGAYAAYTRHLFQCLDVEEKTQETIAIHRDTDRGGGTSAQNLFLIAKAPYWHKGTELDCAEFGKPVVVEIDGQPRSENVVAKADSQERIDDNDTPDGVFPSEVKLVPEIEKLVETPVIVA